MLRVIGPSVLCVAALVVMTQISVPGLIVFVVQLVAAVALSALVLYVMGIV